MKKLTIKTFCWVNYIILPLILPLTLFSASCNGCKKHYNISSVTKKAPKKKSKRGRSTSGKKSKKDSKYKLRLTTKVADTRAEGNHFLICNVYPPNTGTNLKQYKVVATSIEGEGQLLAATSKAKGRFQYELPLGPECQPVSSIYLVAQSSEEELKNGKSIRFRSLYKPAVGAKGGDEHRLNLTIFYHDQQGILVQQYETTACITIKGDISTEGDVQRKREKMHKD